MKKLHAHIVLGGAASYGGESVSQTEHAFQCATLARQAGCSQFLVVACLLHDVGHRFDQAFDEGVPDADYCHETIGASYLSRYFPPDVTEPVRLHVQAKRYLCAIDPSYLLGLSPASKHSLHLQGGAMDEEQCRRFEQEHFWKDSVLLRRFDDQAKDPRFCSQAWESFVPDIRQLLALKTSSTL